VNSGSDFLNTPIFIKEAALINEDLEMVEASSSAMHRQNMSSVNENESRNQMQPMFHL